MNDQWAESELTSYGLADEGGPSRLADNLSYGLFLGVVFLIQVLFVLFVWLYPQTMPIVVAVDLLSGAYIGVQKYILRRDEPNCCPKEREKRSKRYRREHLG